MIYSLIPHGKSSTLLRLAAEIARQFNFKGPTPSGSLAYTQALFAAGVLRKAQSTTNPGGSVRLSPATKPRYFYSNAVASGSRLSSLTSSLIFPLNHGRQIGVLP